VPASLFSPFVRIFSASEVYFLAKKKGGGSRVRKDPAFRKNKKKFLALLTWTQGLEKRGLRKTASPRSVKLPLRQGLLRSQKLLK
jgi:hypothetical protein